MPGLPNQNWIVDQRRPLLSTSTHSAGSGPLPTGISGGSQGYTRTVQPNELASTHMQELGSGGNRVLQQARANGVRAGASRGGINSNLAAAGGEQAWLDAAGQVAMQQAGAYGTAAGQNLSSLANQQISSEGNQSAEMVAGIGAGASMYNADQDLLATREGLAQNRDLTLSGREFESTEAQRGRDFTAGESQRDRDFTTGRDATQFGYNRQLNQDQFGYDQQARDNDLIRTVAGETFSRFLDDPETWDEYSQSGAIELFRRLFDQSRAPRGGGSTQPITPGGP